jgi:hypothetical protein
MNSFVHSSGAHTTVALTTLFGIARFGAWRYGVLVLGQDDIKSGAIKNPHTDHLHIEWTRNGQPVAAS